VRLVDAAPLLVPSSLEVSVMLSFSTSSSMPEPVLTLVRP
jgi:hypothetical protein